MKFFEIFFTKCFECHKNTEKYLKNIILHKHVKIKTSLRIKQTKRPK